MASKIKVTDEMVAAFRGAAMNLEDWPDARIRRGLEAAMAARSTKKPPAGREELMTVLGEVLPLHLADAVILHRIAKRAPLTPVAAQLLVREFKACGNPVAGAEMMLAQGWQGFRSAWYEREIAKERGSGRVGFAERGLAAVRTDLRQEIEDERRYNQGAQDHHPANAGRIPFGR